MNEAAEPTSPPSFSVKCRTPVRSRGFGTLRVTPTGLRFEGPEHTLVVPLSGVVGVEGVPAGGQDHYATAGVLAAAAGLGALVVGGVVPNPAPAFLMLSGAIMLVGGVTLALRAARATARLTVRTAGGSYVFVADDRLVDAVDAIAGARADRAPDGAAHSSPRRPTVRR